MLRKRIIPCLDIKDGRTVKGINFLALRDAGDPVELAKKYANDGADELVFLDISATNEKRKTLLPLVEKIARAINIPFTVGGGVQTLDDALLLIGAGADKVSINSAAVANPNLITAIAERLGSQCVVVAIDTKYTNENWWVYTHGGKTATTRLAKDWAIEIVECGAGELLLTSMDHDGTKSGFAISLIQLISQVVNLPIIASGGAGRKENFVELFEKTTATGALAASVFHFNEIPIPALKSYLKTAKIAIR